MNKKEKEIIPMKECECHYCAYSPTILTDEEGYLYEGGHCSSCGKEVDRNYNLKFKKQSY